MSDQAATQSLGQSNPGDQNNAGSYVDSYAPPKGLGQAAASDTASKSDTAPKAATPVSSPSSAPQEDASGPQALENQNIFHLLGVIDGTQAEKEAFLDELQQVIWEDFIENDVELLITEGEMIELRKIMGDNPSDEKTQESMMVYLEKSIPDLEEIMLEKALELKEDMVRERIAGMREYYRDKPDALAELQKAEDLINSDQWKQAADTLNAIQ